MTTCGQAYLPYRLYLTAKMHEEGFYLTRKPEGSEVMLRHEETFHALVYKLLPCIVLLFRLHVYMAHSAHSILFHAHDQAMRSLASRATCRAVVNSCSHIMHLLVSSCFIIEIL